MCEASSIFRLVAEKIYYYFWSWRIEYLRIFVNWERVKGKKFGISKKPHTLLRIDNQGTFWPNFITISQIYIPYYFAWRREIKFLSFLSFTFKAWFLKRKSFDVRFYGRSIKWVDTVRGFLWTPTVLNFGEREASDHNTRETRTRNSCEIRDYSHSRLA